MSNLEKTLLSYAHKAVILLPNNWLGFVVRCWHGLEVLSYCVLTIFFIFLTDCRSQVS